MSTKDSLETRVFRFLIKYRITPQTTTGIAPAESLLGRKPRARLNLLHPFHRHQDHVIRRETPEENNNESGVVPDQNEQPNQHPVSGNQAAEQVARYPQR